MAASPLPPHLRVLLRGVSLDEFCRFYRADRRVYSRLVVNLNRDLNLSVHVMALWMWLETAGRDRTHIANLVGWPDSVLNTLADEAVECLICMHRDEFRSPPGSREMCFTQNLTNREIGLEFFHKHRAVILEEMTILIDEVCVVAFYDIMQKVALSKARASYATAKSSKFAKPSERRYGYGDQSVYLISPVPYRGTGVGSPNVPSSFVPVFKKGGFLDLLFSEIFEQEAQMWDDDYFLGTGKTVDSRIQHDTEVAPDERTIFLTFSKGYPIPEKEVREYFTRRFGNFIEELHLQEVPPEEQALYARLVVRPASIIGSILNGKSKAKFTINGKHVWARRYVRKNFKPPSMTTHEVPSPPTQP
ncbi:uncharacterized protein LOC115755041 [Rhodamnia argentea]|uniref:Uncharacterized protein LOC115755041 n=1 Tax=Rhodamnia argentea TaxID=178133 RepID=A0A8B8QUW6_9MYRT|nr:uncharacterized protein LOC115755041 [Rhodamnia argentea]